MLQIGTTRQFTATQLPARSVLVCVYHRSIYKYTYRYVVPAWSSWDPEQQYGWTQDGRRGSGIGWLGVRPTDHAARLAVSCKS